MTETREQKAQRLVDEGHVTILSIQPFHALAVVTGDHHTYETIFFASGHFWCECEWGQVHSNTDDLCVHALAVKLAVESDIPKDTDPPKESDVQQAIDELHKALAYLVKAKEKLGQFDKSILAFDHASIYTGEAVQNVSHVLKMLAQEQEKQ